MIEIPILRFGKVYESIETVTLVHHATGEPFARVHQANSGMVRRDMVRMADDALEKFSTADLIAMARKAGELFMTATLPLGKSQQSFDDYIAQLSCTTGMPITYCRDNAGKITSVLEKMDQVLAGLTRGLDLKVLDDGYSDASGHMLSFYRAGRGFGAVKVDQGILPGLCPAGQRHRDMGPGRKGRQNPAIGRGQNDLAHPLGGLTHRDYRESQLGHEAILPVAHRKHEISYILRQQIFWTSKYDFS